MQKPVPILATLGVVIILAAAAGIFHLPAELRARTEPVTGTLPAHGDEFVVVALDERIFTLFAAYNATGFDREFFGTEMHPARAHVREALARRDFDREPLQRHLYGLHESSYVLWALGRGEPPGFERAVAGWYVENAPAAPFAGAERALAGFYEEADIAGMWAEVLPLYTAAAREIEPLAALAAQEALDYLRVVDPPIDQVVIIPNLVDSHYSGYGPHIGRTAYIVAGPTEDEINLIGLVQHEMMHPIVGPMVEAHLDVLTPQTQRQIAAIARNDMPDGYRSAGTTVEETLIRAIGYRMLGDPALAEQQIQQLEPQGFVLIRPLYDALEGYEASGQPLEDYMPVLLGELNAWAAAN